MRPIGWCLRRNEALLAALKPASHTPENPKPPVLWTDARSSLFEIIKIGIEARHRILLKTANTIF